MAEAKVRVNFNLNEVDYQKLLMVQEALSKLKNKKMTITETIIDCIDEYYKEKNEK